MGLVLLITVIWFLRVHQYRKTDYYKVTKTPYQSLWINRGKYGEFLTYKNLKSYENDGAKFLFNLYVPKNDGSTTEIDVLMISSKGLFVIESKNYSGWIFGREDQRNWYQTLPQGRGKSHKESFYNPVMQNRTHIKHLKALLESEMSMYSIITFSDRCTLKSVLVTSHDVYVINRSKVFGVVTYITDNSTLGLLSEDQIMDIYNKLYPYTQADSITKAKHIADIEKNMHPIVTPISAYPEMDKSTQPFAFCPKCGRKLVLRTAKRGKDIGKQFYGCSNFPKCKYIKNLDTGSHIQ